MWNGTEHSPMCIMILFIFKSRNIHTMIAFVWWKFLKLKIIICRVHCLPQAVWTAYRRLTKSTQRCGSRTIIDIDIWQSLGGDFYFIRRGHSPKWSCMLNFASSGILYLCFIEVLSQINKWQSCLLAVTNAKWHVS